MHSQPGACGGCGIWNGAEVRKPLVHWCPARKEETILARLSGVKFIEKWQPTSKLGLSDPWEPGQLYILRTGYDTYVRPRGRSKWLRVRLNTECPYRRAPEKQRPTRARERLKASARRKGAA